MKVAVLGPENLLDDLIEARTEIRDSLIRSVVDTYA